MKTFSLLTCTFFLAALVSSCQKDNQDPETNTQTSTISFGTENLSGGSGLSYTVNLGMIDFYPFHGNADDVSGHGHTGQAIAIGVPPDFNTVNLTQPSLVPNKYGIPNEAYKFDGVDNVVLIPSAVYDAKKTQTQFCFYARYKAGGWGALLSNGQLGPFEPDEPGFSLNAEQDGSATFTWNDFFPGAPNATDAGQITATIKGGPLATSCKNSWVDVAVNFSNSVFTMYINGKKVSTATSPFPGPGHFDPYLQIGTENQRYDVNFFNSAIDEIRVYNRPLTDDEIAYLYAH
ncbi:MAG TPA: LamG domain-containing protein [Mucilaginibacter sp.]|nr:LamG domain-containing protein [Mucilaginibacter sp.]